MVVVSLIDSSDDSYVSAEEDPMEAPVFEFHLQDTVASSGSDVILKCIIAGTPFPEGNNPSPNPTNHSFIYAIFKQTNFKTAFHHNIC